MFYALYAFFAVNFLCRIDSGQSYNRWNRLNNKPASCGVLLIRTMVAAPAIAI